MIYKDSDGDLWRVRDNQLEIRLTLEGTGVDEDEETPADEGWDKSYWSSDEQVVRSIPELARVLPMLRASQTSDDGDYLLLPPDQALARRNSR